MRSLLIITFTILMAICSIVFAQYSNIITIEMGINNEAIISINPQMHSDYGFVYPLTYEFSIPQGVSDLLVYKRHSLNDDWTPVIEKTVDDFYNAIEVVRFDHAINKAFVSLGFANSSDTIFIKITDPDDQNIPLIFNQICKYYDDRDAVVSCSADDYADWNLDNFLETINNFRGEHLWLSIAVNTGVCSQPSFDSLQVELDRGYMEASAHSRTHPQGPFEDPYYEIIGCKQDLIKYLDMPSLFRNGEYEYVYVWVAPYGYNDQIIEFWLGQNQFLANRLYNIGFSSFPEWDDQDGLYRPFGVTREVGPVRKYFLGTGDSTDLNNAYDQVVMQGGIYYLMCHPSIIEWDEAYTWSHLNHISNHNNIWYVSLGHLFVYHFAQENYQLKPASSLVNEPNAVSSFYLAQNYPNPFNPNTVISWQLAASSDVDLSLYNLLGQKIATLFSGKMTAGYHEVEFNGQNLSSGIYLYRIQAGAWQDVKKMVLLK